MFPASAIGRASDFGSEGSRFKSGAGGHFSSLKAGVSFALTEVVYMNSKLRSPIWKMPVEELQKLVSEKDTLSAVLREFGLDPKGGNIKTLKRRLSKDQIDFSHIPQGRGSNKNRPMGGVKAIPLDQIMVENSLYARNHLKDRLIRGGIIPYVCERCGLAPEWQGQFLSLVLDHKNGVSNDHRKENLRFLCPNCNSQTETFCGKHYAVKRKNCSCGRRISTASNLCWSCYKKSLGFNKRFLPKFSNRKVKDRPNIEVLKKQTDELGFCAVGRIYGVSDNAIRKWMKGGVDQISTLASGVTGGSVTPSPCGPPEAIS